MMKKLFLIALLALPVMSMAQDSSDEAVQGTPENPSFKNKRGIEMLPQAGDWSIGIDATTSLRYFGSFLSGSSNFNTAWWQYTTAQNPSPTFVVQGKYFTSATFAFRGGVDINFSNDIDNIQVADDNATNSPDAYVDDVQRVSSYGVTLVVGAEKRKGTGRLQGVYGAELYFHLASNGRWSRDYANPITQTNQQPSGRVEEVDDLFGNFDNVSTASPDQGYRVTEVNLASDFGVGAHAFIGVEYFVLPKISLGGRFAWGVSFSDQGTNSVTTEGWNAQTNSVAEYTVISKEGYTLNGGLNNANGSIMVNFYF